MRSPRWLMMQLGSGLCVSSKIRFRQGLWFIGSSVMQMRLTTVERVRGWGREPGLINRRLTPTYLLLLVPRLPREFIITDSHDACDILRESCLAIRLSYGRNTPLKDCTLLHCMIHARHVYCYDCPCTGCLWFYLVLFFCFFNLKINFNHVFCCWNYCSIQTPWLILRASLFDTL